MEGSGGRTGQCRDGGHRKPALRRMPAGWRRSRAIGRQQQGTPGQTSCQAAGHIMGRLLFIGRSLGRAMTDDGPAIRANRDEKPARRRTRYALKHQNIGQHDPRQQGRKACAGMGR